MYTESLSPEEVTAQLESGKEKIKAALLTIGATATDDNVESLFDADLETRQQVWAGIFRSVQIGAKTFEDWLQAAEGDVPRPTIDAMKTLHDFLNFEPGSLLKELGIVGVVDDRSDEEIEEASEEWEPILQYRETGATSQFLPKDRNWLFRTSSDRILKETEKAYLVSLDGSPHITTWIPKSVVIGVVKHRSATHPGGFLVEDWFGVKNAQSGGPYCQVDLKGALI